MEIPMRRLALLLPLFFSLFVHAGEERILFNGQDLSGWQGIEFGGGSAPVVEKGSIIIGQGEVLSGLRYTNAVPRVQYEVEMEARKLAGNDFFIALTLPVNTNHCTFVCGGWGGGVTGISSLNYLDASENDTTVVVNYEKDRWYKLKFRVEPKTLTFWLDGEKLIEADISERSVSMRPGEIERCMPFGIATFQTRSEIRKIVLRTIP
jgi:hypothetical protein